MNDWYKDEYFYRKKSPLWEVENYGFSPDGMGDLISNTCRKIIEDNDRSEWAHQSLLRCTDLLWQGKRWPNYFGTSEANPRISINWIQWKWNQLWWQCFDKKNHPHRTRWSKITRFFGHHQETVMYRPQHNMTRDPYIYFYCMCIHLDRLQFVECTPIPSHLYIPSVFAWRRYLISPNWWSDFWYTKTTKSNKQFVKDLNQFMLNAYITRL